jgi:hypothetical protein
MTAEARDIMMEGLDIRHLLTQGNMGGHHHQLIRVDQSREPGRPPGFLFNTCLDDVRILIMTRYQAQIGAGSNCEFKIPLRNARVSLPEDR